MSEGRAPEPFSFEGNNISGEWSFWKQKFELFLTATGKNSKDDKTKIAVLLNCIGDEGIKIFNTFEYDTEGDEKKFSIVLGKFEEYCSPRKNLIYEHFKFFKRDQLPTESIDQFVTVLKQLANTCEFKERNVLILDRIVLGVRDPRIQEKLLQYSSLELSQAINICRAMESSVFTQREIAKEVNLVRKIDYRRKPSEKYVKKIVPVSGQSAHYSGYSGYKTVPNAHYYSGDDSDRIQQEIKGKKYPCTRCGYQHEKGKCTAINRYCSLCQKKGHYRKVCPRNGFVHEIYEDSSSDSESECENKKTRDKHLVWTVQQRGEKCVNSIDWFEKIKINGCNINLKVDTGSQVNILNFSDFQRLNIDSQKLLPAISKLSSYTGHEIDVLGQIFLQCGYKSISQNLLFYILNTDLSKSILGLAGAQKFKLVSDHSNMTVNAIENNELQVILKKYDSVFSGIGKVNKYFTITLTDDAVPCISGTRKIPLALRDKVKEKLDEMVQNNLIVPVSEPTDWQNPIVVVPKNKGADIRICMDPVYLNKYIKRERYPIPTQETLFTKLAGAKYFSLLDASSAFLQLPLDDKSSLLCTFTTPFGRFRYLRLPYGLTCSPEFFQRFMHELLDGIPGQITYFDDILIYGSSVEDHNKNLKNVLGKIQQSGLTLNFEKSKFFQQKVKFLGHQIDDVGITPDFDKTKAISSMNPPQNKKELQRFLGMVVYLAKFIPNLSNETSLLRNLLSEKNVWQWSNTEQACFDKIKKLVSSAVTLHYFDPKKKTVLSVDASPYGLGATISQEGRPIEFASVSLTPTQQRYNHIEKELLGLVFGCEKFSFFLYGTTFEAETDHRPLIGLLKKPLDEMSPRIQRLAMRLLRFNFTLTYVPGRNLKIPDTLSRDPVKDVINTDYLENDLKVYSVISTSKENQLRLQKEIDYDLVLQKIKYYVLNGWPTHKSSVPENVKPFWPVRHSIYLHENVLFYQKRLIIPESLKPEFLNIIHQSHQGVVSCKKKAQEAIYYPGLMRDIETLVLGCIICQKYSKTNVREPLCSHEVPELPWQKVAIDFMTVASQDFLVLVDYFSKFVVVNKLTNKTAQSVVTTLKNIFAINGLPMEIFSDNGPPFDSREYITFARSYDIKLTTSSPRYPRSNGMVERSIQTIKNLFLKAIETKSDPFLAIMDYNSTPKQNLPAPCTLLMGRQFRTNLPVKTENLRPKFSCKEACKNMIRNQEKQKRYYDKSVKKLPNLEVGDPIFLQEGIRKWSPGIVVKKNNNNDYIVRVNEGEYRRNRSHLRLQQQPLNLKTKRRSSLAKMETPEPVTSDNVPDYVPACNDDYVTRSGRISRPPIRLSYD